MEGIANFLNSSFFNSLIGMVGVVLAVWQFRRASNIQKMVNNYVRGLYKDSKKILEFAKKQKNYQTIAERARAVKSSIIGLDIANRNLNRKKIDQLKDQGSLSPGEAEEYKELSSE